MMKRTLYSMIMVLAFAFFPHHLRAQDAQDRFKTQLQPIIEQVMEQRGVPGFAIAVVQNQKVVYAAGFGVRNLQNKNDKITPQSLFHMASITKPFVAMHEAYAQTRKPVNHLQDKPGATHTGKEPQAGSNEELAGELIEMEVKDVAAIEETRKAKKEADPKALEAAAQRWSEIKQRNTTRLKVVINRYGWPGRALVGDKAAHAAFIVVQHSDHDREFQKTCLPLLQAAGRRGEIELWQIAFLTDRILVAEGKKQLYGTQFDPCEHSPDDPDSPCAIEDPERLELRRKEMGLPPMSDYLKLMKEARAKSRAQAPKRP